MLFLTNEQTSTISQYGMYVLSIFVNSFLCNNSLSGFFHVVVGNHLIVAIAFGKTKTVVIDIKM